MTNLTLKQKANIAGLPEWPTWLAGLHDHFLDVLPSFTEDLINSIPIGVDLQPSCYQFIIWLLTDPQHGSRQYCNGAGKASTDVVVKLYQRLIGGEEVSESAWSAYTNAYANATTYPTTYATDAAADATYNAAYAAYATDADAYVAAHVADAAVTAAAYSAADEVADAAAYNADYDADVYATDADVVRATTRVAQARALLTILRESK